MAQQALRDLAEATALAARKARLPVLVGVIDDGSRANSTASLVSLHVALLAWSREWF
ncbi:hypothetical protein [Saccharopolyspora hattusasensis]|uniref:hypothetical protein n=1 Tax=Saccharopolyspora hattusasensis TaxID=1128679 RepID=UPI003D9A0804